MKRSYMKIPLLVLAFLLSLQGTGQGVLEQYIRQGLDSNLAVRQQQFDLEKAQLDLRRAKALFFPQANFLSQYTLASGGRTQDIPIGDLLNDVYHTLNQLTGSTKFPQVSNQEIQFLPNDFHDTRVEIAVPVINTDLKYNRRIREEAIHSQEAAIAVYKRELVKQIKDAYYYYLQAGEAVAIYKNAAGLVQENLRVSQKLLDNDMTTRETVLRAQAQVSQVSSSLIGAENNLTKAIAWFNFLLNRPLDTTVETDVQLLQQLNLSIPFPEGIPHNREELAQVKSLEKITGQQHQLNHSYHIPKLNAFYHIGFQGFGFHFNNDQFYQLGGLQLQWSLFRGRENKYKVQQTAIALDQLAVQYDETAQKLLLQVKTTYNDYLSSVKALEAVEDEVQSTQETYRFTERRFREGNALQLELIDARTQLTNASIKKSLSQLAVLQNAAELERVTASYTFKK